MRDNDEQERLLRLRAKDEEAFNELVLEFQGPIFRLIHRFLQHQEEAEDVTQEVFIAVFNSIESFRGESKISTWLYRIAMNHCKNRHASLGRRGSQMEFNELHKETSHAYASTEDVIVGEEHKQGLYRALHEIDASHRALIVLKDLEGLSHDEIQDITGLAEGTVKSRIHRARMALFAAYQRQNRKGS